MTTETKSRPVVVDTELARLWEEAYDLQRTLGWKRDALHKAAGDKRAMTRKDWSPNYPTGPWSLSDADAWDKAEAKVRAHGERPAAGWDDRTAMVAHLDAVEASKAVAAFVEAQAAVRANERAQQPLHDEWVRERWSRFFLVQNTNGHIHSSMGCVTTFPTTQWAWLPTLSGLTEDDAVAQEGTRLCSVCYPSAPVEWTVGLPAKLNPNRCPGSSVVTPRTDRRTANQPCTVCGTYVALSNTGKARPHNRPKSKA